MVLKFKFTYKSSDKTLAKFLDFASKQFDCEYKIYQELDFVYLYVKANEEILEKFSESLSVYIPMSIYYYDVQIEVVDEILTLNSICLNEEKTISFCPSCLKEVENTQSKDFYNAFKSCNICDGFEEASFLFEDKKVESNIELFKKIALLINEDKKIKIKTLSGTFIFSKIKTLDESSSLLVTNIRKISQIIVENKTDIVALVSIEKPQINFKINEIYRQKNSVKKTNIDIRYPNDLTLHLLALQLEQYDISFLNIEEENSDFDYFLDIDCKNDIFNDIFLDIPIIKCFDNKKLILKSNSYPKNLDNVYEKFNEKNKSQFMTVLAENQLFDSSILNFYISTKDDDGMSYYSEKIDGLVDIVESFYIPSSIKEIFEEIQKNDGGKKLVENYKNKFEKEYKKAINTDISMYKNSSFYCYWEIAKIILDFKNSILENANNCFLEKGPRIDYKLFDSKKLFHKKFDYISLIKSSISFKLAGVDEETISLGFIESLAHFIGRKTDTINESYEVKAVSLCGDMFTNDLFTSLVEKSITKNFKIYYNKEFMIQK
ncbi:hypothetical protein [Arcobacter caeni]|uniref:Hydrogenase n=1 Tax=Arcobacter caeni TaxID=1912877 RepID=A0A363D5C9_9BACT|nr:hypothetical protein [Arcobacter caeni]PUE66502.1 hypothetical protein B0174_00160 [Arcobacter caeni]